MNLYFVFEIYINKYNFSWIEKKKRKKKIIKFYYFIHPIFYKNKTKIILLSLIKTN